MLRCIFFLLAFFALPQVAKSKNGEQLCEGHNYNQQKCVSIGCCHFDGGACWSSVGDKECHKTSSQKTSSITKPTATQAAPTYSNTKPFAVAWSDGVGNWAACTKVGMVFGVRVCVSKKAWQSRPKIDHIVNVLAQLLDNDEDGVVDDQAVVNFMVQQNLYLLVLASESEDVEPTIGNGQMTGTWEAVPNSCDTPTNRGATADRSTWSAAVANTPGSTGCARERDATTEEILHLITMAAMRVYPKKWGPTKTSEAGAALYAANGNCGWGYSHDYKRLDGPNPQCTGQYAYNDKTCDEGCIVVEGIYWASVSWMGGLMTVDRAKAVQNEWLMTVPDKTMQVLPAGSKNAKTLEEGSPSLYALVSDPTSAGHAWLPARMPDGKYRGTIKSVTTDAVMGQSAAPRGSIALATMVLFALII